MTVVMNTATLKEKTTEAAVVSVESGESTDKYMARVRELEAQWYDWLHSTAGSTLIRPMHWNVLNLAIAAGGRTNYKEVEAYYKSIVEMMKDYASNK